jgi:hypothetical protein
MITLLKLHILHMFLLLKQSKKVWRLSSSCSLHNTHAVVQLTPLWWRLVRVGMHCRQICQRRFLTRRGTFRFQIKFQLPLGFSSEMYLVVLVHKLICAIHGIHSIFLFMPYALVFWH